MSASISNQPALSEPPKPAVKASRQGLICMWQGLTISGLCCLIRKKPRTSWRYLPRWITIFFICGMNSFYGALEKLFFDSNAATKGSGRHDDTSVVLLERRGSKKKS